MDGFWQSDRRNRIEPRAAAFRILDAVQNADGACGGLNAKLPTRNTRLQKKHYFDCRSSHGTIRADAMPSSAPIIRPTVCAAFATGPSIPV